MNHAFIYIVGSTVAVTCVISSIFLLRLLARMGPLLARLEAIAVWADEGRPRCSRALDELEAQLPTLRSIGASARHVMNSAESLSDGLRLASQPIIDEVHDFSMVIGRLRSLAAKSRAGTAAYFARRRAGKPAARALREADPKS